MAPAGAYSRVAMDDILGTAHDAFHRIDEFPGAASSEPQVARRRGENPQVTTQHAAPREPAVSDRSRWIALYVLCTGALMIVLDATVVNVALPSIQKDLGF